MAASLALAGQARAATVVALTTDDRLVARRHRRAGRAARVGAGPPGWAPGDQLVAIRRPAPGRSALYGIGSQSRLYVINVATGAATQIGPGPFSPTLPGTAFGFDANPSVDRFRSSATPARTSASTRARPRSGRLQPTRAEPRDAARRGLGLHEQASPRRVADHASTASTRGRTSSCSRTRRTTGRSPPVGPLGVDTTNLVGFDIDPNGNGGWASLTTAGAPPATSTGSTCRRASPPRPAPSPAGRPVRDIDPALARSDRVRRHRCRSARALLLERHPGTMKATALIAGLESGRDGHRHPTSGRTAAASTASACAPRARVQTARLLRIDPTTAAADAGGQRRSIPAPFTTGVGLDLRPQRRPRGGDDPTGATTCG